jgi:Uncharacterised nucleotidyltransferase
VRARHRDALIAACRRDAPSAPPRLPEHEWAGVIDAATALDVAGHLRTALARDPSRGGMNDSDWARLQGAYYATGARNAELLTALREILTACAGSGIPVVVLKGAALVETVYGNLAVRPMHDLDLLVRETDTAPAAGVLEGLGFEPDDWYRPREWYVAHMHHLVPYRRGKVKVEVHHRLLPPECPMTVPLETLWERARAAKVAGVSAAVLGPADLVVHLTLHLVLAHHFAAGLFRLRDIAEAVAHGGADLDWDETLRASAAGERAMYAGLRVARDVAGAVVPEAVLDALRRAGGLGVLERHWLRTAGGGLTVRTGEHDVVPTWLAMAWVAELLEPRSWMRRALSLGRRVLNEWSEQGRKRGFGRWSLLFGVFVHPWQGLARRVMRPRRS